MPLASTLTTFTGFLQQIALLREPVAVLRHDDHAVGVDVYVVEAQLDARGRARVKTPRARCRTF
jgi:hypothetical protein